jgi:hypothetical protein
VPMTVPWARCRIGADNESGARQAQQLRVTFCASYPQPRWSVCAEPHCSQFSGRKSRYYSLG